MLQKYNLKYHQNPGPPWSARVAYDAPPNPLVEFAELHAHLPSTNPLTCAPLLFFRPPHRPYSRYGAEYSKKKSLN